MPNRFFLRGAATALALTWLLSACAAAPANTSPVAPAPLVTLATAAPSIPTAAPRPDPIEAALAYADRLRSMSSAELSQEIDRLGRANETPTATLQLAMALGRSRTPGNMARAQTLVMEVMTRPDAEAAALRPLARLLAEQLAEQRRADELAERNSQQLRDAQRRIDQLNDRLDALRAIERSLPSRPRTEATPPRAAKPRTPAQ